MPPREDLKNLLSKLPKSPGLSEILQEVGPRSCSTLDTFKELIQQASSPLTEAEVAKCVLYVVRHKEDESSALSRLSVSDNVGSSSNNNSPYTESWNVEVFVRGLGEAVSRMDNHNLQMF